MSNRNLTLYDILPAYIRQKDENNHTRRFLEAADTLLNRLHNTLKQYYADNFPDLPDDEKALVGQGWLLPYFADLLDARLVSPLTEGKRSEVTNAVRWRQRKGTLTIVDEVAEGVGQWEVVVQEAWKRLAMTPRLDEPLLPESYFGFDNTLNKNIPSEMARHPGLAAATVDFRVGSRAVADEDNHPNSQVSTVHGTSLRWQQQYPHGAPCHQQRIGSGGEFFGEAFDDVSKRTPDLRSSDWRIGHYHPRKILLHVVQPEGFFKKSMPKVQWQQQWLDDEELPSSAFLEYVTLYSRLDGQLVFENRSLDDLQFSPVQVRGVFKLGQVPVSGIGSPDDGDYHFAGLVLMNRLEIDSGVVSFDRCAAANVDVHSVFELTDTRHLQVPTVNAKDCLFRDIKTAQSLLRLEYCTVTKKCVAEALQASDCIFNSLIKKDDSISSPPPQHACIRYSRILEEQLPLNLEEKYRNTRAPVWFFDDEFGELSCGVVHPATGEEVRFGAEDGTEMGAYHFLQLCLRFTAVEDKLKDYLAIGYDAVVIPDQYLTKLPELLA